MNDVAIHTGRELRTIRRACALGLFHSITLAGGYLGIWVAVRKGGWPIDGPNVPSYREHRRSRALVGQRRAFAASAEARKTKIRRSKSRRQP